jgi:hypothetical protein
MQISLVHGNSEVRQRARDAMARIEQESKQREQQRREGRKKGRLSHSLDEKIRSCNPKQLKRVIKLAQELLKEHRVPPDIRDIRNERNAKLLATAGHKNHLYGLEVHPCSKLNCKKCPHGPYVYSYHRDGQYFPSKYHGSSLSRLPRSVRDLFRPIIAGWKARTNQVGSNRTEVQ